VGRPLSPYAASKTTNETYAVAFQMTYGLQTVGLRYFNVFGQRQDPAGAYAAVIPRWIASLLSGERCRIFGDGETTRDFCYIANVVQANLLAATVTNESATCRAYNIACAESISLNQLFEMMRDRLAIKQPRFATMVPQHDPFRPGRHPLLIRQHRDGSANAVVLADAYGSTRIGRGPGVVCGSRGQASTNRSVREGRPFESCYRQCAAEHQSPSDPSGAIMELKRRQRVALIGCSEDWMCRSLLTVFEEKGYTATGVDREKRC